MRKIYHLFFPLEDRIKFPRAGWWQGEDPYYTLHIKLIRTAMLHCFWLSRLKTILGHMLIDSSIHSFIWKYLFECQLYERLRARPCYGMPHSESPVVIMEVSIFFSPAILYGSQKQWAVLFASGMVPGTMNLLEQMRSDTVEGKKRIYSFVCF